MSKLPLHDVIVKPKRRSDVPERSPQQGTVPAAAAEVPRQGMRPVGRRPVAAPTDRRDDMRDRQHDYHEDRISPFEPHHERAEKGFPWLIVALGIGAVILLSSFILSLIFAGATVTVYPKQETVAVNAELNATLSSGSMPFERITIERSTETTLVALREEEVEERASGRITIYNEYSETAQRLIKNTRFKSPDGLIYRIRESIEVPGKKTDGTPGEVAIEVFAEEPGESYNTSATKFSIPGFEGLPQEGKVYAQSVGDIDGGFVGLRRTIADTERDTALEGMEARLRDELIAAAFDDTTHPENYILYKDAVFFEFQPETDRLDGEDKVVLALKGVLHGVLLKEDSFAQSIARATIAGYDGEQIRIDNPTDIVVTVTPISTEDEEGTSDAVDPWLASNMQVQVSGKARLVWEFNEQQLATDLAGMEKEAMFIPGNGGVLAGYPGIDRAEASVRPFWKSTFPEKAEDITVVTVLDS